MSNSDSFSLNLFSRNNRNSNKRLGDARRNNAGGAPLALVEDDALLPPEKPSSGPEIDDLNPRSTPSGGSEVDDMVPPRPGRKPGDFPGVDEGLLPRREDGFPIPADPVPGAPKLPDINVYQQKKTLAQGMMDLALLTANANQLRYVLDAGPVHMYYYVSLTFIVISIVLQVTVGILLLWNSRFNINKEHHIIRANRINNFTVIGIFLITTLNVFISAFGLPGRAVLLAPLAPQIASPDIETLIDNITSTESN